jgi:hypothetical protein
MTRLAVDGSPLAPESLKLMDYLQARSAELTAGALCERIRVAAADLEKAVASVPAEHARLRPIPGKWTIAEVVDHISQTQIRAVEELRHLFAGRRPPLPPVYEALRSGAAEWAPWDTLVADLCEANRSMIALLESAPDGPASPDAATVRTVVVVPVRLDDGTNKPQLFFAELPWKEYALLQRLHLLDHRTQIRNLRAALKA